MELIAIGGPDKQNKAKLPEEPQTYIHKTR